MTFVGPSAILVLLFHLLAPSEIANSRASDGVLFVSILIGFVAWASLTFPCGALWVLLMRVVFGTEVVRNWLSDPLPTYNVGFFNKLEALFRKTCWLAMWPHRF